MDLKFLNFNLKFIVFSIEFREEVKIFNGKDNEFEPVCGSAEQRSRFQSGQNPVVHPQCQRLQREL